MFLTLTNTTINLTKRLLVLLNMKREKKARIFCKHVFVDEWMWKNHEYGKSLIIRIYQYIKFSSSSFQNISIIHTSIVLGFSYIFLFLISSLFKRKSNFGNDKCNCVYGNLVIIYSIKIVTSFNFCSVHWFYSQIRNY